MSDKQHHLFELMRNHAICIFIHITLYLGQRLLYTALPAFVVVPTPEAAAEAESMLRDPKDRPILRAALNAGADLFLTGDKDFLESSVADPRIVSVSAFLEM